MNRGKNVFSEGGGREVSSRKQNVAKDTKFEGTQSRYQVTPALRLDPMFQWGLEEGRP